MRIERIRRLRGSPVAVPVFMQLFLAISTMIESVGEYGLECEYEYR